MTCQLHLALSSFICSFLSLILGIVSVCAVTTGPCSLNFPDFDLLFYVTVYLAFDVTYVDG